MPTFRQRDWCFTDQSLVEAPVLKNHLEDIKYLVYQHEIGNETKKEHIQGYVYFKQPVSMAKLKKIMPTAHLTACDGTPRDNYNYCTKEDTRVPDTLYVYGDIATISQGQRTDLEDIKDMIIQDKTIEYIADTRFATWVTAHRAIDRYKQMKAKPRHDKTKVIWIYGPTGSGKTRRAWETYPDAYSYMGDKWWDGYDGVRPVIIDEFDRTDIVKDPRYVLQLLDRYPMLVQIKGGTIQFNPSVIVITSPYHPAQIEEHHMYHRGELVRRVETTIHTV